METKHICSGVPAELLDVYKIINDIPQDINEITKRAELSISEVNYKIMMLQLQDKVVELPGQRFVINDEDADENSSGNNEGHQNNHHVCYLCNRHYPCYFCPPYQTLRV
mgnify:CR=1 FL=1